MSIRVSIQGYEGSFHHIAAQHFLGESVEVIPCNTFRDVVKMAANSKESDGGFMAIENSIAGSILPNYSLLQKSKLKITGEIYLQINQHLLVNPQVTFNDIREVHSHPMALLQCIDYLEKHPQWKLVETEDTALSAKHIHQHRSKHVAVIASKLAADLFNLNIIVSKIQTDKVNYTRFLFLQREDDSHPAEQVNKASINFHTDHSKGSLAKVLTKVAEANINLSKLQSVPIPGKQWQYSFHADMEFETTEQFTKAIDTIKPLTQELNIYGIYKKGETVG
ncbi:MAG: prephenate dehydratase [Chitinophagaceae bacterium]|nr:prephenate dehydratase [Chitinophagaceae bacterium]